MISLGEIYQVADHKEEVEDVRHRESPQIEPGRSLKFSWRATQ